VVQDLLQRLVKWLDSPTFPTTREKPQEAHESEADGSEKKDTEGSAEPSADGSEKTEGSDDKKKIEEEKEAAEPVLPALDKATFALSMLSSFSEVTNLAHVNQIHRLASFGSSTSYSKLAPNQTEQIQIRIDPAKVEHLDKHKGTKPYKGPGLYHTETAWMPFDLVAPLVSKNMKFPLPGVASFVRTSVSVDLLLDVRTYVIYVFVSVCVVL
jgi:hypothetical protein